MNETRPASARQVATRPDPLALPELMIEMEATALVDGTLEAATG